MRYIFFTFLFSAFLLYSCQKERLIDEAGFLVPRTVDQDTALPSVIVNGARLHAEAFGPEDSTLIVVLHGGPGSDYRYLLRCKELADHGYRVVFFDQRGSGLSQRFSKNTYSMDLVLEDLQGVISHYRTAPGQKVVLLGHSWGAMLATAFINEHPESVDGAILGEPGGFVWQDVIDYVTRTRKLGFFSENLNDAVYIDQFITGGEDQHAILDYKFALWAASEDNSIIGNEAGLPFWRDGAVVSDALFEIGEDTRPDWTTRLHAFEREVLFVYSEHNRAYGKDHALKVSSAYPKTRLFETKDAGHDMLTFEKGWNNTLPVILDYLNNLE